MGGLGISKDDLLNLSYDELLAIAEEKVRKTLLLEEKKDCILTMSTQKQGPVFWRRVSG